MVEKLTRKDILINYHNVVLKHIVNAEVELAILEASPISMVSEDIGKRAKTMSGIQSFVEQEKKELKVVENLILKENAKSKSNL